MYRRCKMQKWKNIKKIHENIVLFFCYNQNNNSNLKCCKKIIIIIIKLN